MSLAHPQPSPKPSARRNLVGERDAEAARSRSGGYDDRRMPRPLFVDADPGIGDALAVTAALLDPELDLIGLAGTAGQFDAETATTNLQSVLALLDPPKWPRLGQGPADRFAPPVDGYPDAKLIHGESGLGDFAGYDVEPADRIDAAKLLIELVRDHPDEVTYLSLGPLSTLHRAIQLHPPLVSQIGEIVILGGWLAGGGDATAAADFNMFADPAAAHAVLASPATITLVPLDVCRRVTLTLDQYDRLPIDPHTRLGQLLEKLLPFLFRSHHEQLGQESIRLDELVALAAVAQRRLFETDRMVADVETDGLLTRGMVVFDRRGLSDRQPNVDVAVDVDAQGVRDYLMGLLRSSGQPR